MLWARVLESVPLDARDGVLADHAFLSPSPFLSSPCSQLLLRSELLLGSKLWDCMGLDSKLIPGKDMGAIDYDYLPLCRALRLRVLPSSWNLSASTVVYRPLYGIYTVYAVLCEPLSLSTYMRRCLLYARHASVIYHAYDQTEHPCSD